MTIDMSADIYTRRLIVTMPDVSGEEADETAKWIERAGRRDVPGLRADHALGETLPVSIRLKRGELDDRLYILDGSGHCTHALEADEARQLAGALLYHADDIDHGGDAQHG